MVQMTQEEWREQLANDENAVVLDVRTAAEVDEGIIPGAVTDLDFYEGQGFINKLNELDKSKNYYVYCRSGNRSGQAAQLMDQLGFENSYNLLGGMNEWDGEVVAAEN